MRQIKLLQSLGLDVPLEAVFSLVNGVPGRPHIARVMMDYNPGRFVSIQQIFDEFLADGARAHVEREFSLTVAEAIALVRQADGLPILATRPPTGRSSIPSS